MCTRAHAHAQAGTHAAYTVANPLDPPTHTHAQGPSGTFTSSSADAAAVDAGPFTSPFSDYRQQQQQQQQQQEQQQRHDEEEARGILSL